MIIEALLNLVYKWFDFLLFFEIPKLPTQAVGYIDTMFEYMEMGAGILANYTPLSYLLSLLTLIISVDGGILIYHFVMWIIKKIPMLGME